jgi:hypothetical protein
MSEAVVARWPVLVTRAKSLLERRRFCAESTSVASTSYYAEMRVRPLARRDARTARPPRVAIRARKPCFLARLRTLGWKVRFVMMNSNFSGRACSGPGHSGVEEQGTESC